MENLEVVFWLKVNPHYIIVKVEGGRNYASAT